MNNRLCQWKEGFDGNGLTGNLSRTVLNVSRGTSKGGLSVNEVE